MRKYEIMIIIDPDVDERQVPALLEKHLKSSPRPMACRRSGRWGKRGWPTRSTRSRRHLCGAQCHGPRRCGQGNGSLMSIDEQIMRAKVMRTDKK
jgi:small subunit ribosomal protein S6